MQEYIMDEKNQLLQNAAKVGDCSLVSRLISSQFELDNIAVYGRLHFLAVAVAFGRVAFLTSACEYVSEQGWQFDFSLSELNPYLLAIDSGDFSCFQVLMHTLPPPDFQPLYSRFLLNEEYDQIFLMVLSMEIDPEAKKTVLGKALIRAIAGDSPRREFWVEYLLVLGANPHYVDEQSLPVVSPLIVTLASLKEKKNPVGDKTIILLLFKALNSRLLLAKFDEYYQSLLIFFQHPKKSEIRLKVQPHFLHWAVSEGHIELVEDIMNSFVQHQAIDGIFADLSIKTEFARQKKLGLYCALNPMFYNQLGRTPLMIMVDNNQYNLIEAFIPLLKPRDFDAVDRCGETAAFLACHHGYYDVLRILLPKSLHQKNKFGDSLLHQLCRKGNFELINYCLEEGKAESLVFCENNAGFTPMLCARVDFRLKLLTSAHRKIWGDSLMYVLASAFFQQMDGLVRDKSFNASMSRSFSDLFFQVEKKWKSDTLSLQISILNDVRQYLRIQLSEGEVVFLENGCTELFLKYIHASLVIKEVLKINETILSSAANMMLFCEKLLGRLDVLLGRSNVADKASFLRPQRQSVSTFEKDESFSLK